MNNASELSIFDDIYGADMSVMQMESIASDLVFLLKHSGLSRSELASRLGWNKSRVTKVLSGDENLTIKTITSVAECLGYGFDVVFYNENYDQPKQPWHIDRLNKSVQAEPLHLKAPSVELKLQNSEDVFNDFMEGNDAKYYISVNEKVFSQTVVDKRPLQTQLCFHQNTSLPTRLDQKDKNQWTIA